MAFTPQGMFYLSQQDLQPSMDTLGTGFRGMLGLQNKEEAVNSILQGADYDTPEGRRAALDQIRGIDPIKAEALTKQNQEYEARELALTEKRNTPALKDEWRLDVGKKYSAQWAANTLEGAPQGLDTEDAVTMYLLGKVRAGTMKNTEKNDLLKLYRSNMKSKGEEYVSSNAGGKSNKGTFSSKDTFGGYGSQGQASKIKLNPLKTEYNNVEKEMRSLSDVVAKASEANPAANVLIHAEASKRAEVLKARLLELKAQLKEEELSGYSGEITSIFDTNAAKYK